MQTDTTQFKESQRQSWDSVSEGWQKWWKTIENGAQNVSNRLVELAHIKSGDKILDLATGIGEPATIAAKSAMMVMLWRQIYHRGCYPLQNEGLPL